MLRVSRIVARVVTVLPEDWRSIAGARFRSTLRIFSRAVKETLPSEADTPSVIAEGAKRLAVGKVSREHAEALKNYAEEERLRIEIAFQQRTAEARMRAEHARADQEETRSRILRVEELSARIALMESLEERGFTLSVSATGTVQVVRPTSKDVFEKARELLLDGDTLTSDVIAAMRALDDDKD